LARKKDGEDSKDKDFLAGAKERYTLCEEYYSDEYQRGDDDLDFLLGNQWPEEVKAKRKKQGRPCLTENRLLTFAHQVINQIRQTRPAINVVAVDDQADVETAKVMRGIIRNIEVQSGADNIYDTAAWNAMSAAYGWMRVNTRYVDDTSFDQEVELIRVPNYRSVMIDPNSKELDGSDAEYGFVVEDISREAFEAQYGDAEQMPWDDYESEDEWNGENTIRICEYFWKEYEDKEITDAKTGRKRTVRVPTVKICKLTSAEKLKGSETTWLGKHIPLIPVYGEEVWQAGRRRCYSLIHQAKDPQTRYNYWLTAETEVIALQPRAPYIGLKGQFATHGAKWAKANNDSFAYVEFDPVKLPDGSYYAQAPQRQQPPTGSPAMFQEMMAAADGIKATLGIFNASIGEKSNETSGKAILARQNEGDNATFHFMDNLQTSIRHVGRILVDVIPKIYSGARILRIIGEDDKRQTVPVNQAAMKTQDGYAPLKGNALPDAFFRLDVGKYDVVCAIGASFATKRMETVSALQTIMQSAPETFQLFGDVFLKNLDIAEADVLAERLKKMNPAMQDGQDPQAAALQQAQQLIQGMQQQLSQMDAQLKDKAQAEDNKMQLEREKLALEAEKLKIEAAKVQAEIAQMQQAGNASVPPEAVAEIVRTIAGLEASLQDTAQAVDLILSHHEQGMATGQPETNVLPT
jgi:hypothetical protein